MSEFHGGFGYLYSMSRDCAVVFYLVLSWFAIRESGRIAVLENCRG